MRPVVFAVASDEARSKAYSSQRLLNFYAETSPLGGKSPMMLIGTPGLRPFGDIGYGSGVRRSHVMADILYVVAFNRLYRVSSLGVATNLGTVGTGTDGIVTMADNGTQLAICMENGGDYIYDAGSASLVQITDDEFFGGTSVSYIDGYFIWSCSNGRVQVSAINDGTDYDALEFATAESSPDSLTRVFVDHREILLFGPASIEPWINTGDADFPFERQTSTILEKGVTAPFSIEKLDNSVFWVGANPYAGGGEVYRMDAYTPVRVSTHAVEKAIAETADITRLIGISYTQEGHAFYGLLFPDGPSWFFDASTQVWHERQTYGMPRWLGASHSFAYGKHIVGSATDGRLFELDLDYFFDGASTPIVSTARSIPIGDDASWKVMHSFQLDLEAGVGLNTGQGSDPQIMAHMSRDRGRTFGNERWRSAGAIGQYGRRVRWNRWGRFRSAVLEFSIADPVKRVIIQALADIS